MTDSYIPWWVPNDHPARGVEVEVEVPAAEVMPAVEVAPKPAPEPTPEPPVVQMEDGSAMAPPPVVP